MARVPTVSQNLVERRADPGATFQAADFGAGGRMVGEAVQRFGATLAQYAETQDRIDAQLDEAATKQLDVEYANWSRARLYTDDGAFYTREGFEAANARPVVEKEIAAQREALLAKATTPRQRAMLDEALNRRIGADMEGVARHATGQLRNEQRRQSAARMVAAADDAVTYAADPERFEQELAVGISEIRSEGARSGAAPESTKRAEEEFVSRVIRRVGNGRATTGDIEGASAWVEANRSRMLPDDARDMDAELRTPLLERQADGIVDDLLGIAPADTDGQSASAQSTSAPAGGTKNVIARMATITAVAESGNRERDGAGRLVTSPKGAQGKMQVMPGTNLDPGFGVTPAKDGSDAERTRVGRDYLAAMMRRYGNDPAKAWAAYNWGPGNVDKHLAENGGKLVVAKLPAETRNYVRGNMAALGGRGGAEVQQAPREHDLAALLRRVDEMNLPFDVEQKVRRQLTERVGLDEQLLRREQAAAVEQAQEILDRAEAGGKPITRDSDIPKSVWDRMGPDQRMAVRGVIERNAQPKERATDYGAYTYLSDLYARDPQAFAKVDPSKYRNSLSNSDYEQVMGWRRDALQSQAQAGRGGDAGQVTHSRIRGVIQNAIQGAGLTYTGLRTRDKEGRAAVGKRQYELEKAVSRDVQIWQRANPGKAISDLEIAGIADRLLVRWKPDGQEWDDANPRFYFERRPGGGGELKIPTSELNRLRAQGRRILGREPTMGELGAAYLREARGGR